MQIPSYSYSNIIRHFYFAIGFVCIFTTSGFTQNQSKVDSLELIYTTRGFTEEDKLENLWNLAKFHSDQQKRIDFATELLKEAKASDSINYVWRAYLEKGHARNKKGDINLALQNYLIAADIAIELQDDEKLITTYTAIGDAYANANNHDNTVFYYLKALDLNLQENLKDSTIFAITNLNLGDEYLQVKQPDSAMIYLKRSEPIFKALEFKNGIAYNQGNIGIAYALQGKHVLAEQNMNAASIVHREFGDNYPVCVYLLFMADIYVQKNDITSALGFAHESLKMAQEKNLKQQISDANLKLAELYELQGNPRRSLKYYKDHITYRDSIHNLDNVQQMANMRTDFEISKKQTEVDLKQTEIELKQTEVDLLSEQKTNQRVLIFTMIAILGMTGLYFRNINKEKRRSDELLLNILPTKTAEELKEHGKVKAKKFESVTVMFTDFQAFTKHSQNLSPEELVKSVDHFFSKFDQIISSYELEKIKTIGDAYMCAGGLTNTSEKQVINMIYAAFEIKAFMEETKRQSKNGIAHFNIRIGMNTGPVVAGVVGKNKFAYDIWGDTVNVASRMESNSEPGKINVSENTYQLIKAHFDCEYRGEIDVKNKGMMKMYFVIQPKNQDQNRHEG